MKPNICMLVLDAARPMNFSCYGHERETTPNVDRIAEESVVFDNAVAPSGVTLDSVVSFLSGLYPQEHRSGEVRQVNTALPLLPEFLREQGYGTYGASSSPSTTPEFGFGRGFDDFVDVTHSFDAGMNVRKFFKETKDLPKVRRYLRFVREAAGRNLVSHVGNALKFKFGGLTADDDGGRAVADACVDVVESADEPWFLYAHFTETHMNSADELPYKVLHGTATRFVDGEVDPAALSTRNATVDYDETTADLHERLYDGAIHYLDGLVGDVVDALKRTGQYEDTLLVVTADHGECIGDHGLLGHGFLYEPGLRIPLVVRHPGEPPRRVSERVNSLWFFRTVVDMLEGDLDHPRGADLFSGPYPETVMVQDFPRNWDWSSYGTDDDGVTVLYEDGLKFIDRDEGHELYDVDADPDEEEDLSKERDTARFAERIAERRAALRTAGTDEVHDVKGATRDRLRELGYIE